MITNDLVDLGVVLMPKRSVDDNRSSIHWKDIKLQEMNNIFINTSLAVLNVS